MCWPCYWYACAKCVAAVVAMKDEIGVKIEHKGHPQDHHTLSLHSKPAAFHCDACQTDDRDFPYRCNDCTFWIHRRCATLASKIRLSRHHPKHRLLLAYQLPDRFQNMGYKCEFCHTTIKSFPWTYHCPRCRYFAHIKCALNALSHGSAGTSTSSGGDHANDDRDLVHFPMPEALIEPLKLLQHVNASEASNDNHEIATKKEINDHWSHPNHPLILADSSGDVESQIDPIVVCNGCVRPLSLPYYRCKDDGCRFFLHKYCAELPRTLTNHLQLHLHDSLDLVDFHQLQTSMDAYYKCSVCSILGNSFLYQCRSCSWFKVDVNCTFLPNIIKHEAHNHPLHQQTNLETVIQCQGCGNWFKYDTIYSCIECGFQVEWQCALMAPRTHAHRYCKGGHEVPLRYPPIDHLADFWCDICDKEILPRFWMYYCDKCDNSFHVKCLALRDPYENYHFEGTITVPYHKHPLTYARRRKTLRFVCLSCNRNINGHLILECRTGTCPFRICESCHRSPKWTQAVFNWS